MLRECKVCRQQLESHENSFCDSCLANTFVKCNIWTCENEATFYDVDAEMHVCYECKSDIVHYKKYGKWSTIKRIINKHLSDL